MSSFLGVTFKWLILCTLSLHTHTHTQKVCKIIISHQMKGVWECIVLSFNFPVGLNIFKEKNLGKMRLGVRNDLVGLWREMGGQFKGEGTYVDLWLIHVDVWQKPTKFCKAIILQLKNK